MQAARGFTLFELVMVIAIIGILGASLSPVLFSAVRAYEATRGIASTLDNLRYANDRIAFELRQIAPASITNMSAASVAFSRVDYLPAATSRIVTIAKSPANSLLTLNYSTPLITPAYVPVLANNVSTLKFDYYDQDGNIASSAASVRFIKFSLALNYSGKDYEQITRVALRNY